jgi:hypothetical protein
MGIMERVKAPSRRQAKPQRNCGGNRLLLMEFKDFGGDK